jgi:alkylhydroperoxidase family enzyme
MENEMKPPERLVPLKRSEWTAETRELLDGLSSSMEAMEGEHASDDPDGDASGTVNIVRTIAHHPKILGPFLGFAGALALEGVLSRRISELLALRAIWNCQSAFEWGHHVVFARAAGLSDEEIQRIPFGPDHADWSEDDRLLLRAADELHSRQDLTPETWSSLRKIYSDAQLVELPFVVGQYTMLSMVAGATGVPVEAGLEPLPEALI